jgi:hypothetical protein
MSRVSAWRTSGRVVTGPGIRSNINGNSHAGTDKSIHAMPFGCYKSPMNTYLSLPDWVPWWVPMVLLVPALLYSLAFLFMPFSVLGVKTRLEVMEARLDEIQQEIRHLALRLPVGQQEVDFEDVYAPIRQPQRREASVSDRPPIPPAVRDLYRDDDPQERPAPAPNMRPTRRQEPQIVRPERAEPRLGPRPSGRFNRPTDGD